MRTKRATKRLLALLLTFVFAMAMSITAFAYDYDAGDGSITISNATAKESYSIYQIFSTDSTGQGSITATANQMEFYVAQDENPFTFTHNTAGTYNVSVIAGYSDEQVIRFLQGFIGTDGTLNSGFSAVVNTYGPQTAETDTVVFEGIPYGYYLVTSSLGTVITVDSTNPAAKVIDKNQDGGSDFTKKVSEEFDKVVEIGEEFEYTLSFTATNYDGATKITQYMITDILDNNMELVYEKNDEAYGVSVQVGDRTVSNARVAYVDDTLTIKIPWVNDDGDSLYDSPSNVTVKYTVKLDKDAEIQEDIKNTASLTWTGKPGSPTEDTETVQTYALAIMKVDSEGNPLANATFAVTKNNGEAVNVSSVPNEAGVYVVDPSSTSNTVVSPASGLIVIKGVDNVQYTLTETAAPAGYNLLNNPVTITPVSTGSTTVTIYYDGDGNVTDTVTDKTSTVTSPYPVTAEVVENHAGSLLPSTGGMGTTTIYILGAALVIGAGVVLVVRRRMSA